MLNDPEGVAAVVCFFPDTNDLPIFPAAVR
jgi:hypothetical protein